MTNKSVLVSEELLKAIREHRNDDAISLLESHKWEANMIVTDSEDSSPRTIDDPFYNLGGYALYVCKNYEILRYTMKKGEGRLILSPDIDSKRPYASVPIILALLDEDNLTDNYLIEVLNLGLITYNELSITRFFNRALALGKYEFLRHAKQCLGVIPLYLADLHTVDNLNDFELWSSLSKAYNESVIDNKDLFSGIAYFSAIWISYTVGVKTISNENYRISHNVLESYLDQKPSLKAACQLIDVSDHFNSKEIAKICETREVNSININATTLRSMSNEGLRSTLPFFKKEMTVYDLLGLMGNQKDEDIIFLLLKGQTEYGDLFAVELALKEVFCENYPSCISILNVIRDNPIDLLQINKKVLRLSWFAEIDVTNAITCGNTPWNEISASLHDDLNEILQNDVLTTSEMLRLIETHPLPVKHMLLRQYLSLKKRDTIISHINQEELMKVLLSIINPLDALPLASDDMKRLILEALG